jgi:3,4-dihydroxy 2-butanone 4-phosphate synthase/GTP cyclohydrolase II
MTEALESDFDSVEVALAALAAGGLIIVTDDEGRENEGDLVMAAAKATPEQINFMIRHARGLICVPMIEHSLERLGIADMVPNNRESFRTAFTVSVDAAEGITTGISAYDRAQTVLALASTQSTPSDLVQPGHIFPLRAREGGVLERAGHTEAAIDLVKMAGMEPCAVICEVLSEDGSMARLPELTQFKREHGLPMISVAQLIEHRLAEERLVDRVLSRPFPSEFGDFTLHLYRSRSDKRIHSAFTLGDLDASPTLVRVQVENALSDVFRSKESGGYAAIEGAMKQIAEAGKGAFLYLSEDSTDPAAMESTGLTDEVAEVDKELRRYGIGAQILTDLGLKQIRLLTSRKRRLVALQSYGLEITEHVPLS